MFKILIEDIDRTIFFNIKESRTRGHKTALVMEQHRLDARKYLFSQRTINKWYKLSSNVNVLKQNFT